MSVGFKNLIINSQKFSFVSNKLRDFFLKRKFVEVHTQNRLSILAACEDPTTISNFEYAGVKFPLPQTGQMWLECEMLENPNPPGYFCVSTSYRNEPNPVPGRHELVFPMFEFELKGGFEDLWSMEVDLLEHLGYNKKKIRQSTYHSLANQFNTVEITHIEEMKLYNEFKCNSFFLTNFPEYTSPFWNMKRGFNTGTANKIDVILSGMETIGSAERETDIDLMRQRFLTISNGEYAKLLYRHFGCRRVNEELDAFLSYKFFPRSGGGIGMTRLIRSMELEGLIPTM
jgi:aspartyl/asparaginyl-tRNA synthetase